MTSPAEWIAGARPKTLGAALAPVLLGTAVAAPLHGVLWWRALGALVVASLLQVGVNYANDYSDGIRGTDTDRVGPMRLVGSGAATSAAVKRAAAIAMLGAGFVGLWLSLVVDWRLLIVGAFAVIAAVGYTGGARPYGYRGLGEVIVFLFFGVVATVGAAYVQVRAVPGAAWWASVVVGCPAAAVLLVNNIRDIETDAIAGKHTLAVRLGGGRARQLYRALMLAALFGVVGVAFATSWWALLGLLASPAIVLVFGAVSSPHPPVLIEVLVGTVRSELLLALATATGLWVGSWS